MQYYCISTVKHHRAIGKAHTQNRKYESVFFFFFFLERDDHTIGFWDALNICQTSQRTFFPKKKLNTWVNLLIQ